MEEGQNPHDAIAWFRRLPLPGIHLGDIDGKIGMGEHRAFRRARGAAGILQHGDRIGREAGPRVVSVIGKQGPFGHDSVLLRRTIHFCQAAAVQELERKRFRHRQERGEFRHHGLVEDAAGKHRLDFFEQHGQIGGDHDGCVAVANLKGDLLETVEGVEVHNRAARLQHGVVEDDEGGRIGQEQADLDAFLDAESLQPLGRPVGSCADLGEAQALAHEEGTRGRPVILHGRIEQVAEEAGLEGRVPIDRFGIDAKPRAPHGLPLVLKGGPWALRFESRRHRLSGFVLFLRRFLAPFAFKPVPRSGQLAACPLVRAGLKLVISRAGRDSGARSACRLCQIRKNYGMAGPQKRQSCW